MVEWLLVLISYLLGSIPTAYIVSKGLVVKKGDKNVGTLNTLGVTNSKTKAIIVLVIDMLKGYISASLTSDPVTQLLVVTAVVLGHNYSVWIKFKGGMGLATMIGVIMKLNPIIGVIISLIIIKHLKSRISKKQLLITTTLILIVSLIGGVLGQLFMMGLVVMSKVLVYKGGKQ